MYTLILLSGNVLSKQKQSVWTISLFLNLSFGFCCSYGEELFLLIPPVVTLPTVRNPWNWDLTCIQAAKKVHSSSIVLLLVFITAADKKSLLTNCVICMPNRFFKIIFYRQVLKSRLCLCNHQVVLRLQWN